MCLFSYSLLKAIKCISCSPNHFFVIFNYSSDDKKPSKIADKTSKSSTGKKTVGQSVEKKQSSKKIDAERTEYQSGMFGLRNVFNLSIQLMNYESLTVAAMLILPGMSGPYWNAI